MTSVQPQEENQDRSARVGEEEPLLGREGDASQEDGKPLIWNLLIGTGVITQAGVVILLAIVWGAVLRQDLMLFSAHPLLNSVGVLLLTQAVLILQPTHTPSQKRAGTLAHATINAFGGILLVSGLIVIEVNKFKTGHTHFDSTHAILGLITYILLAIQAAIGFTQYWVPQLYGGVENAKAVWKYHRMGGYVGLVVILSTVCAATQTTFNKTTLHIRLWTVIVTSVIILIGIVPRIKKQKLGF